MGCCLIAHLILWHSDGLTFEVQQIQFRLGLRPRPQLTAFPRRGVGIDVRIFERNGGQKW